MIAFCKKKCKGFKNIGMTGLDEVMSNLNFLLCLFFKFSQWIYITFIIRKNILKILFSI